VLPLAEFLVGNRRTALRDGELLTAIEVPARPARARSTFLKLGARRYLVISIAMVAALIEPDEAGVIRAAAIAVGACAPVARRLPELEAELVGHRLAPGLGALVDALHLAGLAPITDVRGTAEYRRDAVATLVRRALEALAA
jgi:CO/xanthine dehydrogenase FAD-binding subunit